ncbi:tRNA (adenosine(37)-N6)-threonylcarbamoyltransferase complex dimerization subunit type 1 TsaB [Paenibacillus protaetiae]|uniref:tRNA (Adenosine(37)-N6)-threonylcarbamoyltransferase complex dimerization subunit type 1 TsaB n=1 Tax=Paenibacillus protaetiae TaxID=2509456 RepID=A0A4P6F8V8_9BACL|nr:tRNA (adenosine(37)-N6)-threonylcarbamoyltransferase complex dimerization subunit type 1 TsaB [Paenibacillus protaetiae]QAY66888.1 tRNA (adenosine(37)-N6)-threonylcarbamoyltransferase complex dimerization subunit type 1 TsaB [Paenibacillus protaetiae]
MSNEIERPVLAFDTSTACLAGAVIQGDQVLSEVQSFAERNHSVQIINRLQQLLDESGVSPDGLGGIVVGQGPGSYTGMRIAVAAAKTLAWAWGKPLAAVSSLEAMAYGGLHAGALSGGRQAAGTSAGTEWVLPIMDARRGQVYTGGYKQSAEAGWTCFAADGVRLMKDWADDMAGRAAQEDAGVQRIYVTGDLKLHLEEAERLREQCRAAGVQVELLPYDLEGRWLAQLGRAKLRAGQTENVHTFIPNYTQLVEAEVKLLAKQAEAGQP